MATATPYPSTQQARNHIAVYNYYNDYEGEPSVVALYETWTRYGGPEEGGWYYECGEPIKCICVFNKKQAIRAALQLQQEAQEEYGSERDELGWSNYRVCFERGYPKAFPQERPYYC
jgi:hypothetical protein